MELMIYGAGEVALGVCSAVRTLHPQFQVKMKGFLVTSPENNPSHLAGLPVMGIAAYSRALTREQIKNIHILIATPEYAHPEIIQTIEKCGFTNYSCISSGKESELMEAYYTKLGNFPSLHTLEEGNDVPETQVIMVKSHKDRPLEKERELPEWVRPIQAGAALAEKHIEEITDDTGENISTKNGNYCEMTAFYWLWKNRLTNPCDTVEYYGICHYRRMSDISRADLKRLKANDVDAVLIFPTLYEPDIKGHHRRYITEQDWGAMLQALNELQPEYAKAYDGIFTQPYFYNYNMIIAKKKVLADFCAWLFPILKRIEQLSEPRGWERSDRYIGYISESLMTLYFLYNGVRLHIRHTGIIILA